MVQEKERELQLTPGPINVFIVVGLGFSYIKRCEEEKRVYAKHPGQLIISS